MSTLKANNVANTSGGPARSMDDIVGATPRAWVNFNGTGTVAIRASYNVTSIVDNGTADYTVNFTNPLPDDKYAMVGSTCQQTTSYLLSVMERYPALGSPRSSSAIRVITGAQTSGVTSAIDADQVNLAFFR